MVERDLAANLQGDFLVSRLEDLCSDPNRETRRILAFLGLEDEDRVARSAALVRVPSSLGRWRRESPDRVREVVELIRDDLERHGYTP
jgi:hypothetical protein